MSDKTPEEDLPEAHEAGTHPMSIAGAAAGIVSILTGAFCCLDPRLAGITHTLLGLIAVGLGGFIWVKVSRGQLPDHNLFQAKMALGLGGIGLAAGIGWLIWWSQHPFG